MNLVILFFHMVSFHTGLGKRCPYCASNSVQCGSVWDTFETCHPCFTRCITSPSFPLLYQHRSTAVITVVPLASWKPYLLCRKSIHMDGYSAATLWFPFWAIFKELCLWSGQQEKTPWWDMLGMSTTPRGWFLRQQMNPGFLVIWYETTAILSSFNHINKNIIIETVNLVRYRWPMKHVKMM